jgi:hypothetical protein
MVPVSDLLRAVKRAGKEFEEKTEFAFKTFRSWKVNKTGLKVDAVFTVLENDGGEEILEPFSFRLEHNGMCMCEY